MDYQLIRSRRKSLAIEIKPDGTVLVRAPLFVSARRIENFLYDKEEWIEKTREKLVKKQENLEKLVKYTDKELDLLRKEARPVITKLCEEYAEIMGVDYDRISIRTQKTRWGSCSSAGNLNFNVLLMLVPDEVRRYVVVHELCHLTYMDHSKDFWRLVSIYRPDYKNERKWLKQNGNAIIALLPDRGENER